MGGFPSSVKEEFRPKGPGFGLPPTVGVKPGLDNGRLKKGASLVFAVLQMRK